jgi:hypothetical protein
MALDLTEALAHNIVHKNCEKHGTKETGWNKSKSCHIFVRRKIVERDQALAIVGDPLLTHLSTEVVCNLDKFSTRVFALFCACLVFAHGKFSLINQYAWGIARPLHTVLSTKVVQNSIAAQRGTR